MSGISESSYFEGFADALRAVEPNQVPAELSKSNKERFKIYRNNVLKGYIDALNAAYPVVAKLVGDNFFQAMAKEFHFAEPPTERSLALHGKGFAAFIALFPPAASLPYLADIATLERAWLEAYHAEDVTPLAPDAFAALDTSAAKRPFDIHPSVHLVCSEYPIFEIWMANRQDSPDGDNRLVSEPQNVLVCRPEWDVQLVKLTPDQVFFLQQLLEGKTIEAAFEAVIGPHPSFDVTTAFAVLLSSGIFVARNSNDLS